MIIGLVVMRFFILYHIFRLGAAYLYTETKYMWKLETSATIKYNRKNTDCVGKLLIHDVFFFFMLVEKRQFIKDYV